MKKLFCLGALFALFCMAFTSCETVNGTSVNGSVYSYFDEYESWDGSYTKITQSSYKFISSSECEYSVQTTYRGDMPSFFDPDDYSDRTTYTYHIVEERIYLKDEDGEMKQGIIFNDYMRIGSTEYTRQ
mgnify:FL=1